MVFCLFYNCNNVRLDEMAINTNKEGYNFITPDFSDSFLEKINEINFGSKYSNSVYHIEDEELQKGVLINYITVSEWKSGRMIVPNLAIKNVFYNYFVFRHIKYLNNIFWLVSEGFINGFYIENNKNKNVC